MTYTLSQVTESIGTITLDHERRRNALSHALVEEVIAALRSFQEAKVRVVILRAKPGANPHFSHRHRRLHLARKTDAG
jgi:methylmalonyl-CoA decarboxylase